MESRSTKIEPSVGCIAVTLKIIGDKWTALILRDLTTGPQRFTELQKSLVGISPRTLSQRLESLAEHKIVTKTCYPESPPRTEYNLTTKGRELVPILKAMAQWGHNHTRG